MNRLNWLMVTVALVAGCAVRRDAREMNYLGSALTKVSAALQATVRYRNPAPDLSESALLQAATAQDRALLNPFAGFTVRIRREGRNSAVLVCNAAADTALLEDSGCTPGVDAQPWRDHLRQACQFRLDLNTLCTR